MNLPNRLSLLRIALIPFVLFFMMSSSFSGSSGFTVFIHSYGMLIAGLLFGLASFTDFLDGYIARSQNLVTKLGKFLDPIADKLLVLSVFIAFVQESYVSALVPIIILLREFIVTGLRMMAAENKVVLAAGVLGKTKTVTQMIALIFLFLRGVFFQLNLLSGSSAFYWQVTTDFFVYLCVFMTLISGYDYFKKYYHFLLD